MRILKYRMLFVAVVVLVSIAASAQQETKTVEVSGAEDLVQEKSKKWGGVWIHPDADISKYDNLYPWQAVFQFREIEDKTNRTTIATSRRDQGPFAVSEESKNEFEKIVTEVVIKELGRSKQFDIVDSIGPRTLAVRGAVLDIASNVPPNVTRQENIHLTSVGEATFFFELIDAETGIIQARVGDRRLIQPPYRMNQVNASPTNAATVWADVERWARDQAQTLRKELDKLAKKPKK